MDIIINGQEESLNKQISLLELINQKGLDKEKIIVELNLKIVQRENLENTQIRKGDSVEIVSFVGGG